MRSTDLLSIGEVSRRSGFATSALRYYEREGLIPEAERTASGYRVYDEGIVQRLRFIRGSQRIGLRLREIKGLLEVMDRGLCPCGHASDLVTARIAELDQQIAELGALRSDLARLSEDVGPDRCTPGVWPCEQEFIQRGGGD